MKEAALRARNDRRKTILDRDVIREKDLFSIS
jgi:histone H3/H4